MRAATKEWWQHFEFPRRGRDWLAEWKQMRHDLTFLQAIAVIVGVFAFLFLLIAVGLQPYILPDTSFLPAFNSPWQRGWPYPMW